MYWFYYTHKINENIKYFAIILVYLCRFMYKKELYNREIYFLSDEHADEYAVFTVP